MSDVSRLRLHTEEMSRYLEEFPVRDPELVRTQMSNILDMIEAGLEGPQRYTLLGMYRALTWIQDEDDPTAPWSGKRTRATRGALTEESATTFIAGMKTEHGPSRCEAQGIFRATEWALDRTGDVPVPLAPAKAC